MPGITKQYPKLKSFEQHGVGFSAITGNDQATGSCPFCKKTGHFYVHVARLVWDCKSCGRSGNLTGFFDQISRFYEGSMTKAAAVRLGEDRSLRRATLRAWRVGWSGEFFTIPCSGNRGGLATDIHRFYLRSGKNLTRGTVGAKHSLIVPAKQTESQRVWIMEGEWDGMAMWECLERYGAAEAVYALPGAGSFKKEWSDYFVGKDVILMADNDTAGHDCSRKLHKMLTGVSRTLKFIHWPDGFKDGFDFRDLYLAESRNAKAVLDGFIPKNLRDYPPNSADQHTEGAITTTDGVHVVLNPDQDKITGEGIPWKQAVAEYRKWLHLRDPSVLDVLFGTVFANRLGSDPLWVFLVAPPGGSKSELLMSLRESPMTYTMTSLTPKTLISGANFPGVGDPSLIPRLNGKVLVVKDFTTILSLNQTARDEILGMLRDAYDGETAHDFGNGVMRRYCSKFGILAGVTPIIEKFTASTSVLGERFIKYRVRQTEGMPDLGAAVIMRAMSNIGHETEMREGLRSTARSVLNREVQAEHIPLIPEDKLQKIMRLAQWTATLRGVVDREKYTGQVTFRPSKEIGTRLAKQLCALALGIGIWRGETQVTQGIYRIIVNVAKDTTPGRVEDVVRVLFKTARKDYASTSEIAEATRFPGTTVSYICQDLVLLGIIEQRGGQPGRWRLSDEVLALMLDLDVYRGNKTPRLIIPL